MPPKKSDAPNPATGDEGTPSKDREGVNVEDYNLPRTIVQRLAKGVLPANTQIQKDALLAMSKSATVFVSYLTAYANENAMKAHKRTIQPKDVLDALSELEFEAFLPRLEAELARYTEIQTDKRNTYRNKVKAADKTAPNERSKSPQVANGDAEDGDTPPPAKKARRSSVAGANGDTESAQPAGAHSGDETVTDEGDQEAEDAEESEEDVEDGGEEDVQVGDEPLEELDPQASVPPEDEALDNGDDSD
ncbi:hypothetical protein GP486_001024 [Trichoglossum hirsutum]|uniref:DNA polymerase epsilon subunit D n=1 Tax=Trichoglossum hirsutum TaxID=265104 RepID=A0A9P8LHL9_9PEZI|nr:hypothetical protein GP486_001024 [Trichoglossum hirsutum]